MVRMEAMKIKKLRYRNFRNFAKEGEIDFDINGKMTIIYGTNGDGKTTLHQLFQWILYERVNFNKTTSSNKLYNLEIGSLLTPECSMFVWGEIEFEHNRDEYLVRREWEYYKQRNGDIIHKLDGDSFYVQKKTVDSDWKMTEDPEAIIEEVLPSGLSPYFFFDGETMIADLKIRGTDSAKTLRTALYSIFELEVYENALRDIGNTKKSSTVLGHLEKLRLDALKKIATEEKQKLYIKEIRILSDKLEIIETENKVFAERILEYNKRIKEISEQIGTNKSKKQLENSRALLIKNIEKEKENIKKIMLSFGSEIVDNYSYLLITEVVKDARKRLYLQVQDEEQKLIPGLSKELLINLLKNEKYNCCICGNTIGRDETLKFEEWKSYFPPASYKSTYDKFTRNAIKFSGKYNENSLILYFQDILAAKTNIRELEEQIADIDKELGGAANIDALIDERRRLERDIISIKEKNSENDKLIGDFEHQKTIRIRKTSSIERAGGEVEKYEYRIALMEEVVKRLKNLLIDETKEYSDMLKLEIQNLIDIMLTSRREVFLNEDFQLQVTDSYGDESKSEGQFAVISFAYIGGILKVLKSHEKLAGKEYPLILDGPFSKLDEEQKSNVVNEIPKYAPQVIIFSKDPLNDYVRKDNIGKLWTIISNEEKNNAQVVEGYLWK